MWNCRGVGGPLTIFQLNEIINFHSPNVVFLCETKNQQNYMRQVQKKIRFENGYFVNSIGRAGGLVLFWNNDVSIDQVSNTDWYIVACIEDKETKNH